VLLLPCVCDRSCLIGSGSIRISWGRRRHRSRRRTDRSETVSRNWSFHDRTLEWCFMTLNRCHTKAVDSYTPYAGVPIEIVSLGWKCGQRAWRKRIQFLCGRGSCEVCRRRENELSLTRNQISIMVEKWMHLQLSWVFWHPEHHGPTSSVSWSHPRPWPFLLLLCHPF
jgi:hypothetical protein